MSEYEQLGKIIEKYFPNETALSLIGRKIAISIVRTYKFEVGINKFITVRPCCVVTTITNVIGAINEDHVELFTNAPDITIGGTDNPYFSQVSLHLDGSCPTMMSQYKNHPMTLIPVELRLEDSVPSHSVAC